MASHFSPALHSQLELDLLCQGPTSIVKAAMIFNKGVRCHPPQLFGLFRLSPADHLTFGSNAFTNEAFIIGRYDKILNTVIYFTNFDRSFGITNTVSSDYILSSFFFPINVKFPSFIDKHTDEHFWTDASLPRDSIISRSFTSVNTLSPQLIIDLQCTMKRTIQSTDGRRLLHLSHLRTLQALGIERGPFYSGHL